METPTPTPETTAAPADAQQAPPSPPSRDDLRARLEGMTIDEMATSTGSSVTPSPGEHAPGAEASPEKAADETGTDGAKPGQEGRERDESGKFKAKGAGKDAERAAKTWDEINAEKARLETERAALEQARREFDAKAATIKDAASKAKASASDLRRFAEEFKAEGRDDLAEAALSQAAKLEAEAGQVEQQAKVAEFRQKQDAVIREVVRENPALADRNSELYRMTSEVLKRVPALLTEPAGLKAAVEYAKAHTAASRIPVLEKELAEVKQRLAEREKLLQPATGGPSSPSGEVPFETLSTAERSKRLRESLKTADTRSLVFA